MPDLFAISNAIAARFAPGQVTPPAGYPNIRAATASPRNAMLPMPCVIVFADGGSFDASAGNQTRFGVHDFLVRFYYNQTGDIIRDSVALQKWVSVLADQLRTGMQLGGIVAKTTIDAYKIGYLQYGGKEYAGCEFRVSVTTSEGWAAVA